MIIGVVKQRSLILFCFLTDKRLDFIPVGMNIGTVAVNKELIAFCHNTGVNGNSAVKLVLKRAFSSIPFGE